MYIQERSSIMIDKVTGSGFELNLQEDFGHLSM